MRTPAGLLSERQLGGYLSESDAIRESVLMSVLTQRFDRWGAPDFGTRYLDSVQLDENEGLLNARVEATRGLGGESLIVNSLNTELNEDHEITTTIVAQKSPDSDNVLVTL